jgi:hypothetical protein
MHTSLIHAKLIVMFYKKEKNNEYNDTYQSKFDLLDAAAAAVVVRCSSFASI